MWTCVGVRNELLLICGHVNRFAGLSPRGVDLKIHFNQILLICQCAVNTCRTVDSELKNSNTITWLYLSFANAGYCHRLHAYPCSNIIYEWILFGSFLKRGRSFTFHIFAHVPQRTHINVWRACVSVCMVHVLDHVYRGYLFH